MYHESKQNILNKWELIFAMWYNGHSYLYRISINIHLTFYASVVDLIFNGEIYIDSKELLSVVNTGNVAMLGNSYRETDNQFL